MIRVCIVEDQTIVRQGLRSLLGLMPDIVVGCEAVDGVDALEVIEREKPDVVLDEMVDRVLMATLAPNPDEVTRSWRHTARRE